MTARARTLDFCGSVATIWAIGWFVISAGVASSANDLFEDEKGLICQCNDMVNKFCNGTKQDRAECVPYEDHLEPPKEWEQCIDHLKHEFNYDWKERIPNERGFARDALHRTSVLSERVHHFFGLAWAICSPLFVVWYFFADRGQRTSLLICSGGFATMAALHLIWAGAELNEEKRIVVFEDSSALPTSGPCWNRDNYPCPILPGVELGDPVRIGRIYFWSAEDTELCQEISRARLLAWFSALVQGLIGYLFYVWFIVTKDDTFQGWRQSRRSVPQPVTILPTYEPTLKAERPPRPSTGAREPRVVQPPAPPRRAKSSRSLSTQRVPRVLEPGTHMARDEDPRSQRVTPLASCHYEAQPRRQDSRHAHRNRTPTFLEPRTHHGVSRALSEQRQVCIHSSHLLTPNLFTHRQECFVCLDESRCMLASPCHHLPCCEECSVRLEKCPLCRAPVENWIKAHL